jgi:hypothetical protein
MRTCYLHIGHAKTATSSLQTFMHKNDDLFEACGVWVPGDFRSFRSFNCKAIADAGRTFSGNLAPVFNAKAKGDQAHANTLLDHIFSRDTDVLLSTELIFYYKFMVREVIAHANKRGFSVTLVAYLKRQDRAIIPTYYQNIRNHGYFKNVLSFLDETAEIRYFRYAEVIDAYGIEAPNRIIVRTFEPEFLVGGDIVDDFVGTLGLDIPLDKVERPKGHINPALPLESLEIIRGLNALRRADLVQKVIDQSQKDIQPGEGKRVSNYFYTREVASVMASRYMAGNDELVAKYLPNSSELERHYWVGPPDVPAGPLQLNAGKLSRALACVIATA